MDQRGLYLEPPPVPPEFEGTAEWGNGYQKGRSGKYVARTKRNIDGLVQAGRAWQQCLMEWLKDTLGSRIYMNGRSAFECLFAYENDNGQAIMERLIGTAHVDDVLLSVQGTRLRAGFMRIPKAHFVVAGCENEGDEAMELTGIGIRRSWQRKSIAFHQTGLASRLLEMHYLAGARLESMPYKTKRGGPWP
jgi:hypothetical protein